MARFNAPSLAKLIDAFPSIDPDSLKAVRRLIRGEMKPREVLATDEYARHCGFTKTIYPHLTLHAIDTLLQNHGVECIEDINDEVVAEYSNSGDSYAPTILFNHKRCTWCLTSWGDFVETYERNNGRLA